ncbi:Uncharacterised protein [Mycobacteroides abscessus]|nr:Uncharacterised protein [Mycobacteroides abscessus]
MSVGGRNTAVMMVKTLTICACLTSSDVMIACCR